MDATIAQEPALPVTQPVKLVEVGWLGRLEVVPAATADATAARLAFDGAAGEYFRIWVVHMLLNVLTLGIYSPWAKVRKARWFAQHTILLGDRFDYHGRAGPILLGRVVALALLVAWSYAFEISTMLGFIVFAVLCITGPLLFASAQRFRFANTSWRGLRFGFEVPRMRLYLVCVPALLVWTLLTVLQAAHAPRWALITGGTFVVLSLPLAHARLTALQHSCASFAGRKFTFDGAAASFYGLYVKAGLFIVLAAALGGVAAFVVARVLATSPASGKWPALIGILFTSIVMVICWAAAWPYFAARMQAVVWPRTHWGDIRFRGDMRFVPLTLIVFKGVSFTLLSAGLAWPWFAVALARYRVESMSVLSDAPLDQLRLAAAPARPYGASGDAAADFFGLDLGW